MLHNASRMYARIAHITCFAHHLTNRSETSAIAKNINTQYDKTIQQQQQQQQQTQMLSRHAQHDNSRMRVRIFTHARTHHMQYVILLSTAHQPWVSY